MWNLPVNAIDMNRRHLLQGLLAGVGATVSLSACTNISAFASSEGTHLFYNDDEYRALSRIADLIIPRTETPGAIDAGVPAFMDGLMANWASETSQIEHRTDLEEIFTAIEEADGGLQSFIMRPLSEAEARLRYFDAEAFDRTTDAMPGAAAYRQLKSTITNAYFASEAGATQERVWVPVPGRWDPAVPIRQGDTVGV